MTPEIPKALKESIAHWKRMRANIDCGEKPGAFDCALCRLFPDECALCPLRACAYSVPYTRAADAWHAYRYLRLSDKTAKAEWKRTSTNMIRYMESKLPKPVAKKKGK